MTREEAREFLIDISYKLGDMSVEYLSEKDGEKMREAIKVLEQESNTWNLDDAREDFMSDVYNTLDFLPTNNEANRIIDSFDRVTSGIKQESILNKIRTEIEKQEKWLLQAGCNTYNVDIAFSSIKSVLAESEVERWQPKVENYSIKMVTNAKEAENYPISENISKSIEEINKLLFENRQAESEDIELVIKISEDSYKATCIGSMLPSDVENVVNAIKNGTPLPKGHGDLIDADVLRNETESWGMNDYEPSDFIDEIDRADVVIKADKKQSEG